MLASKKFPDPIIDIKGTGDAYGKQCTVSL